jgi:cell division septation protein DedD
MAAEDTEITLGVGKLLGLFFMLAATCGIFFAVGYSLGKTSAREEALKNQAAQSASVDPDVASPKPSGKPAAAANSPAVDSGEPAKEPAPDLTFYKSVKQGPGEEEKSDKGIKTSESATSSKGANSSAKKGRETPVAVSPATEKPTVMAKAQSPATAAAGVPQAGASGTYLVQIAAVTHEEDAAALAGALRKKSYAAAVVPSPNGKDKLFHVVLGPYASLQDAEAMKLKLQGEGYSPIVKR